MLYWYRLVLWGEREQGNHLSPWPYSGSLKQPLGVSRLTMSPLVPMGWPTCAPDLPSYHRSDRPERSSLYCICVTVEYTVQWILIEAGYISFSFPGSSSVLWFSANEPGSLWPVPRWGGVEGSGECSPQDLCYVTDWRSTVWSGRGRREPQVRLREKGLLLSNTY